MIKADSFMISNEVMRQAVDRPSICEGYAKRVGDAAAALLERWAKEHPDRTPLLRTEWDEDTWTMTIVVRDGGVS